MADKMTKEDRNKFFENWFIEQNKTIGFYTLPVQEIAGRAWDAAVDHAIKVLEEEK